MTTADVRREYADEVRRIADRIEVGAGARTVQAVTFGGKIITVNLPETYPIAPRPAPTTVH